MLVPLVAKNMEDLNNGTKTESKHGQLLEQL